MQAPQGPSSLILDRIDGQIDQSRLTITSKDKELACLDQALQLAELEKNNITQGLNTIGRGIHSLKDRIAHLLEEKKSIEEQLKLKKDGALVFKELNSKTDVLLKEFSTKPEVIHILATVTEKEIAGLKGQLQTVGTKLEEAEVKLSDHREKLLHKIVAELREKSQEVESLREVNAQTKLELDLERAKVEKLRMQQTAAKEKERYTSEVKVKNTSLV